MTEVIKEFLISLGYEQKGQAQFVASVTNVTKTVMGLALAVKTASLAVVAGTAKMASSMEDLYYASQRTGATVAQINALGSAASQMGSSAQDARASLEGLAQRLRTNPGYGGMLRNLLGENVDLNNTANLIDRLAVRFRQMANSGPMGYSQAFSYAQQLGISEPMMRAMIEGMDRFNAAYRRRLRAFGVDSEEAARAGNAFMRSLRDSRDSFDIMMQRVLQTLAPQLSQELDRFNQMLEANGTEIQEIILMIARAILQASTMITDAVIVIGRGLKQLYDWFKTLSPETQEFIRTTAMIVAAWKILNLSFLASPIGAVLALAAAIVLLWQDYQTFKAGGETLIDWTKWEPAVEILRQIGRYLSDAIDYVGGWQTAFALLAAYIVGSWAISMVSSILKVVGAIRGAGAAAAAAQAAAAGSGAAGAAGAAAAGSWVSRLGFFGRTGLIGAALGATWLATRTGNIDTTEDAQIAEINRRHAAEQADRAARLGPGPRAGVVDGSNATHSNPLASTDPRALPPTPQARAESERNQQHQQRLERILERGNEATEDVMDAIRIMLRLDPTGAGGPAGGLGGPRAAPGAAPSVAITGEEQASRIEQARAYFRSQGYTEEQTAGLLANLHVESGFRPDITGDGGRAYGLAQWHPDRQRRFGQRPGFEGRSIQGSTFQEQLEFIAWELNNNEAQAGGYLRGAQTPEQAGEIVSRFYERPADRYGEMLRRGNLARGFLARGGGAAPRVSPAARPGGSLGGILDGFNTQGIGGGAIPRATLGGGGGAGGVAIQQTTNITVQGGNDPAATGRAVAAEQNRVNAELTRNAQGAVR